MPATVEWFSTWMLTNHGDCEKKLIYNNVYTFCILLTAATRINKISV